MSANLKKISVTLTPEIECRLDKTQKELFCNRDQSDMIRAVIEAGLDSLDQESEQPEEVQDAMDRDAIRIT